MTHRLLFVAILVALSSSLASAAHQSGPPCDRSVTPAILTAQEQQILARDGIVERMVPAGDYFIGYMFAEAGFDAELAMGVYVSCGQHAGPNGLGDFIKQSNVETNPNGNPFTVFYEQTGSFGYSGGEYRVENTVGTDGPSYLMNSRLVWSDPDQHFAPKVADAYVRMAPMGPNKVFVIACNYMEPNNLPWPQGISRGQYNGMAKERLYKSGVNLMRWVSRVSQNSSKAESYREHLKTLLGAKK